MSRQGACGLLDRLLLAAELQKGWCREGKPTLWYNISVKHLIGFVIILASELQCAGAIVVEVPESGRRGFFYLMSKPSVSTDFGGGTDFIAPIIPRRAR